MPTGQEIGCDDGRNTEECDQQDKAKDALGGKEQEQEARKPTFSEEKSQKSLCHICARKNCSPIVAMLASLEQVWILGKQFGASFLWIQKVTISTASGRPQAPSGLHCHGV